MARLTRHMDDVLTTIHFDEILAVAPGVLNGSNSMHVSHDFARRARLSPARTGGQISKGSSEAEPLRTCLRV